MTGTLAQAGIVLFGVAATLLMAVKNRWGIPCGLAGQICWFYFAYTDRQWAIFAVCFAYTASWLIGLHAWWVKPALARRRTLAAGPEARTSAPRRRQRPPEPVDGAGVV